MDGLRANNWLNLSRIEQSLLFQGSFNKDASFSLWTSSRFSNMKYEIKKLLHALLPPLDPPMVKLAVPRADKTEPVQVSFPGERQTTQWWQYLAKFESEVVYLWVPDRDVPPESVQSYEDHIIDGEAFAPLDDCFVLDDFWSDKI